MPVQKNQEIKAPASTESEVSASIWALNLSHRQRVLLAGLLAAYPVLGDMTLTPSDWAERLAKYESSPRR